MKKEKKGRFYFFAFLVYVYVPKATATSITDAMIAVADENSFTVVVGVGLVDGNVTLLPVGMKYACSAHVLALTL